MPANPEMPTDTPLIKILRQFEEDGFTGQFQPIEGPEVRCLSCRAEIPVASVDGNRIVRLEGASDPDDMLAVVPVTCGACAVQGTLVLNFGPNASPEDADVIAALERSPLVSNDPAPHPPA
jgi:hypothetical protein